MASRHGPLLSRINKNAVGGSFRFGFTDLEESAFISVDPTILFLFPTFITWSISFTDFTTNDDRSFTYHYDASPEYATARQQNEVACYRPPERTLMGSRRPAALIRGSEHPISVLRVYQKKNRSGSVINALVRRRRNLGSLSE